MQEFFLREGGGFVRHFDESHELFTTVGTAAVTLFKTDPDHPRCMRVSGVTAGGAEAYVSQVIPGVQYVFEASYRATTDNIWRANVYDVVNGATIWTATTLHQSTWANLYKPVTTPANCSVVRISFKKVSGTNAIRLDDVFFQGNLLLRDPDDYSMDFPQIAVQRRTAGGRRVQDVAARHVTFNMGFPDTTATAMARLIQGIKNNNPAYLDDGNALVITNYGTIFASKTYNLSGVSQGGGGATAFRTQTTANRPIASDAVESTEVANSQYVAMATNNNAAATFPIAGNSKYQYGKIKLGVTDYATTTEVKSITLTVKGSAEDLSANDTDGVELFAWDKTQWAKLDTSRNASKQTLTFTSNNKEIARRFVDTANNRIYLIQKTRGTKDVGASLYMKIFYAQVTVNDGYSQKIALTNKVVPSASGGVVEVRNQSTKKVLRNRLDYQLNEDRDSINVRGVFASPDGAAQYYHGGDNLDGGTGDFCLSAWVRCASIPAANAMIMQKWAASAGYYMYIASSDGSLVSFMEESGGSVTSNDGASICDNEWHHVAVTYDRDGNMKRYVDGVAYGSTDDISARTLTVNNGANFVIGANSAGDDLFFTGDLADCRVLVGGLWSDANVLENSQYPYDINFGGSYTSTWYFADAKTATVIDDGTGAINLTLVGGTTTNYDTHSRTLSGAAAAVIRVRFNQYFQVANEALAEPKVYGGPVGSPRGVGSARFVTLNPID